MTLHAVPFLSCTSAYFGSLIRLLVLTPLPQICWSLPARLVRLGAPGGGSIYTFLSLPPVLDHCVGLPVSAPVLPFSLSSTSVFWSIFCCLPGPCCLYPSFSPASTFPSGSCPACPAPSGQLSHFVCTLLASLQSAWLLVRHLHHLSLCLDLVFLLLNSLTDLTAGIRVWLLGPTLHKS